MCRVKQALFNEVALRRLHMRKGNIQEGYLSIFYQPQSAKIQTLRMRDEAESDGEEDFIFDDDANAEKEEAPPKIVPKISLRKLLSEKEISNDLRNF